MLGRESRIGFGAEFIQ